MLQHKAWHCQLGTLLISDLHIMKMSASLAVESPSNSSLPGISDDAILFTPRPLVLCGVVLLIPVNSQGSWALEAFYNFRRESARSGESLVKL